MPRSLPPSGPVVACVDGDVSDLAAVDFALQRARMLGAPVHVAYVGSDLPGHPPVTELSISETATATALQLVAQATTFWGRRPATAVGGKAYRSAEELARYAGSIVVGTHAKQAFPWVRMALASLDSVRCPVFCTTHHWSGGSRHLVGRDVVVAVADADEAAGLLSFAVSEARMALSWVRVVHPPGVDVVAATLGVRQDDAEVRVRCATLEGDAARALVAQARDASMLVVGSLRSELPVDDAPGGLGERLRSSGCPVVLVGPGVGAQVGAARTATDDDGRDEDRPPTLSVPVP